MGVLSSCLTFFIQANQAVQFRLGAAEGHGENDVFGNLEDPSQERPTPALNSVPANSCQLEPAGGAENSWHLSITPKVEGSLVVELRQRLPEPVPVGDAEPDGVMIVQRPDDWEPRFELERPPPGCAKVGAVYGGLNFVRQFNGASIDQRGHFWAVVVRSTAGGNVRPDRR